MSDRNFKEIRKQIRNVVREELAAVLSEEFAMAMKKKLSEELGVRMDEVATSARETLKVIDERQKDLQSYLSRILEQMTPPPVVPSDTSTPPADSL